MNREQYENIIANALRIDSIENFESDLSMVKAILNKMGVPLPTGDLQDIFHVLQTNNYMGWRLCTLCDAQEFASKGIASIGIGKNRISILSVPDEAGIMIGDEPIISLTESTNPYSIADMLFYSYTAMRTSGDQYSDRTWGSLDAAKDYYGWDYTYTYCGGYYNYYYTYSDGSRQYFHVG